MNESQTAEEVEVLDPPIRRRPVGVARNRRSGGGDVKLGLYMLGIGLLAGMAFHYYMTRR